MLSRTPIWGALVIGSASVLAQSPFSIDSDASIKQTAGTLAWDMLQYYKGNLSGGTPGILPGPPPNGDYYWWQAGAMWGALIDYWAATGDSTYNEEIVQAMQFQTGENGAYEPRNQTLSLGNDDQAFWGMSAMLAAELKFPDPPSNQPGWLELAQRVFHRQTLPERHDDECGGGMRWQIPVTNTGYNYKNSIANGCFFNMGARLARYTNNNSYADWAEKTWDWVYDIGYVDHDTWAVYDGGYIETNCTKYNPVQYSYNNAVFAHGAAFMYDYTKDKKWENIVDQLVSAATKFFFSDGIATETACEESDTCNADRMTYKGFLLRWYANIAQLVPSMKPKIQPLLEESAKAAISQCTGGTLGRQCGIRWNTGKYDGKTGSGQEMSAMSAVQSLLMINMKPPVTNDTGGTSKGKAGGDFGDEPKKIKPITTGQRVGASIITVMLAGLAFGTLGWIILDVK